MMRRPLWDQHDDPVFDCLWLSMLARWLCLRLRSWMGHCVGGYPIGATGNVPRHSSIPVRKIVSAGFCAWSLCLARMSMHDQPSRASYQAGFDQKVQLNSGPLHTSSHLKSTSYIKRTVKCRFGTVSSRVVPPFLVFLHLAPHAVHVLCLLYTSPSPRD